MRMNLVIPCAIMCSTMFALQEHDVVVQQVVPFADQFDDGIALIVVREDDLDVQGGAAEVVPLRMDHMVVHRMAEFEFAVLFAEEGERSSSSAV